MQRPWHPKRAIARMARLCVGAVAGVALFGACTDDIPVGILSPVADAAGGGGTEGGQGQAAAGVGASVITVDGGSGGGVTFAGAGSGGEPGCMITECLGKVYACGDCDDNDDDGSVDAADELCLGPCDDTEDSLGSGTQAAGNNPCRQDCYFDRDAGPGNDGCYYSHTCDPVSLPDAYPPSGDSKCEYDRDAAIPGTSSTCDELVAEEPTECLDYCLPLTPNGCDCFGCCELPANSEHFVWLGSESADAACDLESIDDEAVCHPCTPVHSCYNPCDECELCVGRPELDPACTTGEQQCDDPFQPCGQPGQAECPTVTYCVTGCCVPLPK